MSRTASNDGPALLRGECLGALRQPHYAPNPSVPTRSAGGQSNKGWGGVIAHEDGEVTRGTGSAKAHVEFRKKERDRRDVRRT